MKGEVRRGVLGMWNPSVVNVAAHAVRLDQCMHEWLSRSQNPSLSDHEVAVWIRS